MGLTRAFRVTYWPKHNFMDNLNLHAVVVTVVLEEQACLPFHLWGSSSGSLHIWQNLMVILVVLMGRFCWNENVSHV